MAVVAVVASVWLLEARYQLSAFLDPDRVESWLVDRGPLGPLLFIGVMAGTVISPLPTLPLDLMAGRLFGPFLGTLYALVGATLGALFSFQLTRWLGRDLVARFLEGHINFCTECSDKLLTKVVFLARLVPAVSFDAVSYGATCMRATRCGTRGARDRAGLKPSRVLVR